MSWIRYAFLFCSIFIIAFSGCKKTEVDNTPLLFLMGSFASAAEPTFDLPEAWYTEAQTVTISCETDGAGFRYTTDGTEPTAKSPELPGGIPPAPDLQVAAFDTNGRKGPTARLTAP